MEQTNIVAIMGIAVTELEPSESINGTKLKGWRFMVETKRLSGVSDHAEIYITEKTNTDGLLPFMAQQPVMIIGKLQTCKDFKTKRVLTFVLADHVAVAGKGYEMQNDVKIAGKLGKGITYRERNSGKRITTIMLEVPSAIRAATSCYIPCICWQALADKVKEWSVGDEVELTGRLQSRDFVKHTADEDIARTSYEVSIFNIKKLEKERQQ